MRSYLVISPQKKPLPSLMQLILEFPESASCPVSIYNFVCSVLLTHHPAALKPWVQAEFGAKGNRFMEEQSSFFPKGEDKGYVKIELRIKERPRLKVSGHI